MATMNPILDEINGLSPAAKAALQHAHEQASSMPTVGQGVQPPVIGSQQKQQAAQAAIPPPSAAMSALPSGVVPYLPGAPSQQIKAPRGTIEGDTDERGRLIASGSGVSQIHNPILKGLATAGSDIAQLAAPKIAAMIPGTEAHHQMLLHGVNNSLAGDINQAQHEAQIQGTKASTARTQAETNRIENPPDRFSPLSTEQGYQSFDPATGEVKPLTSPEGTTLQPFSAAKVRTIDEQAYDALTSKGKTPIEALDTIYGAKNTKTEDLPHLYLDALQSGDTAKAELIKKAHQDTQVKPATAPGVTMIVPNAEGGGTVQRLTAGQSVAPGALTTSGFNAKNTPTMQQRNVAAQASLVHEQTPQIITQIDQMKDSLGPVAGRWNEYMQGKVGMDNPQLADLRANLLMYSSAVALMHARGRLPENLREEFDKAINSPKQTAGNLEAIIKRIDQWTTANMNAMQHGGSTSTAGQPQEGEEKTNSSGDHIVFRGGKWGPK